jgi:thymidylate synthase
MEIIVFQQSGSAEMKVKGIARFGENINIKDTISINGSFEEFVENPEKYIPSDFEAELVLNFLKHPDLSDYLVKICVEKKIPVVTTGKPGEGFTPFTCCGLGKSDALGHYGEQFGFPEYSLEVEDGKIAHIKVDRGAPCGATWEAIVGIIGMSVDDAMTKLPLKVQQNCYANPAAFDPISGKSSVHYAGYVHIAALKKAVLEAEQKKKK